MSKTIVITHSPYLNRDVYVQYDNKEAVEINIISNNQNSLLGNIYIGKVKNLVKNISAAFVEISKNQVCYFEPEKENDIIFVSRQSPNKLCEGDEILVQVSKDAHKNKRPFVTANLNFPGKYVVLTSGNKSISMSSKLSAENRAALNNIASSFENEEFGLIFRTNAKEASEEDIFKEINQLKNEFQTVKENANHKRAFATVKLGTPDYISSILGLYDQSNVEKIITDNEDYYNTIKEFVKKSRPEFLSRIELHNDNQITLNALYGVDSNVKEATNKKVWLKSGGYLFIEPTEAMTVIDVNSGKAVSKKKTKDTFLKINMEAAKEISKQLRVRNISGIIMIDFIDMENEEDKSTLMDYMKSLVKPDPVKTTVVDITKLNLMEVTRKRIKKSLSETLVDNNES